MPPRPACVKTSDDEFPRLRVGIVCEEWNTKKGLIRIHEGTFYLNPSSFVLVNVTKAPGNYLEQPTKALYALRNSEVIPRVLSFNRSEKAESKGHETLVSSALGLTIEKKFGRKMPFKAVALAGSRMIQCLQRLHKAGFLHRRISPSAFRFGLLSSKYRSSIFLWNLLEIAPYLDSPSKSHIPYGNCPTNRTSHPYSSISAIRGKTLSRRDDLESLGYVLLYLLHGRATDWKDARIPPRATAQQMNREMWIDKRNMKAEEVCTTLPPQFIAYFHYVYSLDFDETPDYKALQKMLLSVIPSRPNNELEELFNPFTPPSLSTPRHDRFSWLVSLSSSSSSAELSMPIAGLCNHLASSSIACVATIEKIVHRKQTKGLKHEFLVLKAVPLWGDPIWIRLERAAARRKERGLFSLRSSSSVFKPADTAKLATEEDALTATEESEVKAELSFEPTNNLTLDTLQILLSSLMEVSKDYTLWKENCYFFCSVVLKLLGEHFHANVKGKYTHLDLGVKIREEIERRFLKSLKPTRNAP